MSEYLYAYGLESLRDMMNSDEWFFKQRHKDTAKAALEIIEQLKLRQRQLQDEFDDRLKKTNDDFLDFTRKLKAAEQERVVLQNSYNLLSSRYDQIRSKQDNYISGVTDLQAQLEEAKTANNLMVEQNVRLVQADAQNNEIIKAQQERIEALEKELVEVSLTAVSLEGELRDLSAKAVSAEGKLQETENQRLAHVEFINEMHDTLRQLAEATKTKVS